VRRRGKVDYPVVKVQAGMSVILNEEASDPKLGREAISKLKKLSRLAYKLVIVRANKASATNAETKLKEQIIGMLDEFQQDQIIGLVRHAGPETSTELKRVEVTGRDVADSIAMLNYLGEHSGTVVKSVQLPFELMVRDPAKFNQALSYLVGLYGEELLRGLKLDLNVTKYDSLQKAGELGDEPDGLWRYKRQGDRIEARIIS
jgi:hypothetical protein